MLCDLLFLGRMYIQGSRMSVSAVGNQLLCFCKRLIESLCPVHSEYRRQLLMREFFGYVNRFYFSDQDLGIFRNVNAGHLRNLICGFTRNLVVQSAIDDDGLAYLI